MKSYTKSSIKVDNKFSNRKQFQAMDNKTTMNVFSYGDLVLYDPRMMFRDSIITIFTLKGGVTLISYTTALFINATSFDSDLSRWKVKNVKNMDKMLLNATSFDTNLSAKVKI